ncbi:hypothetical protein ACFSTJ_18830 [Ottowia pentelensis]|uniref:hypothetical protein n=1 Tax=Ottowia pentelensis TaxID=511108 RepID=UPI00362AA577
MGAPDHLTRVVIWRDDGTEAGQYVECLPPEGAKLKDFTRADGWTLTPMPPRKPGEPPLPHEHDRSHVNLLPKQRRNLWPDGALVVTQEWTSHEYDRACSWNEERDQYADLLTQAAQMPSDTPGRLQVVDGNRNEIEYRDGLSLNGGYVHIAWLNAWGDTQQPVNVFHNSPATTAEPIDVSEQQPLLPWKMEVQAIAAELWITWRQMGANPTIAGIVDQVAKRCAERGIKTSSGVNPRSGYLRTHVLSSKHWTPPPDDRRG